MIRAAIALLLLSFTVPAGAQGINPAILRALAGTWLVAPADGTPGCRVTLQTTPAIGGYRLSPSPACAQRVPAIADAVAWNPVDGISLSDPTRRILLRFRENEDASYSTTEPAPGYVLVRAPEAIDRVPHARDAFGDWVLRRPGGEVVCRIHLSDRPPPGGQESYAVRVIPQGCQSAVTRLRLASWRIEAPKLVLYGVDGNSLSFLLTPSGFAKDPAESGRPLLMERAGR